jgi:hypothetical protein
VFNEVPVKSAALGILTEEHGKTVLMDRTLAISFEKTIRFVIFLVDGNAWSC